MATRFLRALAGAALVFGFIVGGSDILRPSTVRSSAQITPLPPYFTPSALAIPADRGRIVTAWKDIRGEGVVVAVEGDTNRWSQG